LEKLILARSKKVFLYTKDPVSNQMELYKSFDSFTETSKFFDCSRQNLTKYVDKNKLFKKQWLLFSTAQDSIEGKGK